MNTRFNSSIVSSDPVTRRARSGLIVVCGATASGKSGLGLAIAAHLQAQGQSAVILSADSRQVYRKFTIGTAKPIGADLDQVPHYLLDICDPTETLTVAEFQDQAQALIEQCHHNQVVPLLVGGTGLYLKAIVRGMKIPRVPPHPDLRQQLVDLGQGHCYQLLQHLDPAVTEKIHANDQVRTLRALEVFYATGQPMSAQQGEDPPNYPILTIGLDSPAINDRIAQRAQQMFDQGFVTEVAGLVTQYGENLPLLNTLGYAEVRQFLRGEISEAEAVYRTALHTRQFAKRQRTWFRSDPTIIWYDSDAPNLVPLVCDRVDRFLFPSAADT
jgi:tRNA dimethylallyltransferase